MTLVDDDADDATTHAGIAIAGGISLDVGDDHGKRKRVPRSLGVIRSLPPYVAGFAPQAANGVMISDTPNQFKVWELRYIAVWVVNPLFNQASSAAVHIGSSPDAAVAGTGNNLECLIPRTTLPIVQTDIHVPIRNGEFIYAVLVSATNLGYMKLVVEEYDEQDYFFGISRT